MKKIFISILGVCLLATSKISAQTNTFPDDGAAGIGTTTPNASSMVDIVSTSKGVLIPRMTKAQRDMIVAPATGLLIFQLNASPGFYFFNGSSWSPVASKGANGSLSNLSAGGTAINMPLLPNAHNTLDLGSPALNWNELYVNTIRFMDGTTQSTAGGGGGYTAGVGINIAGTVITNTGDTNAGDDLTTATNFNGDVTGVYNNLQLSSGSVGSTEIADDSITSTDILNGTIGSADLSSMGASTGQVMQYNGTSWVPVTIGAGAETDPQVGLNTTGYIPKWNGTELTSGLLQDNGSSVFMGASIWALASKMAIENTSTTRNLYLVNSLSGTGTQEGVNIWLQNNSTGIKRGISNAVWQSMSGTGAVYGLSQEFQKYGTGSGYGTYNNFDIIGSSTNYGTYTNMGGGSGSQYGSYTSLNSSGSQFGHYVTLGSGDGNHFGYFVTSTGTTGTHYGLWSQVSTANSLAYSAYLVGKVYMSGNVGISTLTPSTKLHIEDGSDAGLGSGGFLTLGTTSTTNIVIDNNEIMARNNGAASTLYLNNDGGNLSLCYAGGNVMIGASAPAAGYLLTVDGKVMCEELKVQMSEDWPDFVFDDNYKLMSLADLEASINANNHLPGVPSASEIEADGLEVGDMQVIMMQKIEELTLYIIELQRQIDALKAQ